ncbi:MAG: hypothetical protein ACYTFY_09915 [Planctomycetota bacterium]|jgi:hypothetical protein
MAEIKQKSLTQKLFKIAIWSVLIILTALIAVVGYIHYTASKDIEKLKAEIRAEGYPLTIAELKKLHEGNIDSNASEQYKAAIKEFSKPSDDDYKIIPYVGLSDTPTKGVFLTKEELNNLTEYVNKNKRCIELIHEATLLKQGIRPEVLDGNFPEEELDYLRSLRTLSELLAVNTLRAANLKDRREAGKSNISSLALATSLNKEPLLVSQLVRIALCYMTIGSLEDSLSLCKLDNKMLSVIERLLYENESPGSLTSAFIAEQCFIYNKFDKVGDTIDQFEMPQYMRTLYHTIYVGAAFKKLDCLLCLEISRNHIKISKLSYKEQLKHISDIERQLPIYAFMAGNYTGAIGRYIKCNFRYLAKLRVARTAMAVERYCLKNNTLPEYLEQLIPEFIKEIPIDPFSTKSVKYIIKGENYIIYSVGEDQIDNGGKKHSLKGIGLKDGSSQFDITFSTVPDLSNSRTEGEKEDW